MRKKDHWNYLSWFSSFIHFDVDEFDAEHEHCFIALTVSNVIRFVDVCLWALVGPMQSCECVKRFRKSSLSVRLLIRLSPGSSLEQHRSRLLSTVFEHSVLHCCYFVNIPATRVNSNERQRNEEIEKIDMYKCVHVTNLLDTAHPEKLKVQWVRDG